MLFQPPEHHRIHLAKVGLDYEHEIDEKEVEDLVEQWRHNPSHKGETPRQLFERAAYHIITQRHAQKIKEEKRLLDVKLHDRLAHIERSHGKYKKIALTFYVVAGILMLLLLFGIRLHAQSQGTVIVRGNNPGTTAASTVSVVPNCATNTNCLAVQPVGAGSGGTSSTFGQAFPAAGTAVGVKNGLNMVNLAADGSSNLLVNCAVGCSASGAADTVGTTSPLNALNTTATVTLAGDGGAGLFLAAGTLVGTIVPELSYDGGTTWIATQFWNSSTNVTSANAVFASANPATELTILVAGGASTARVRVSAFTSGTANATLRATSNAGSLTVNQGNGPWTVNVSNTVTATVSGTVTDNQGTPNTLANGWPVKLTDGTHSVNVDPNGDLNIDLQQVAGSAVTTAATGMQKVGVAGSTGAAFDTPSTQNQTTPANMVEVGCEFNTTPTTITSGNSSPCQLDASANLLVNLKTAIPAGTNQIGHVIVDTAPTTAVTQSTSPWVTQDNSNGATGTAVPTRATYIGANGSGNLTGIIACDGSVAINNATSGNTQLVALVSGKTIFVCSFSIQVGGTNTAKLVYGTGTACATGQTDVTGPYGGAAQSGVSQGSGIGMVAKTAASNALCINNSTATQVSGLVTFTQF